MFTVWISDVLESSGNIDKPDLLNGETREFISKLWMMAIVGISKDYRKAYLGI